MKAIKAVLNFLTGGTSKGKNIDYPINMEEGSYIRCKDKVENINMSVTIVPNHINPDADILISFPRFSVVKTSSKEGQFGMYSNTALYLDTDDYPQEGSKNLITSGTLFEIVSDLYEQINTLKNKIEK